MALLHSQEICSRFTGPQVGISRAYNLDPGRGSTRQTETKFHNSTFNRSRGTVPLETILLQLASTSFGKRRCVTKKRQSSFGEETGNGIRVTPQTANSRPSIRSWPASAMKLAEASRPIVRLGARTRCSKRVDHSGPQPKSPATRSRTTGLRRRSVMVSGL
jgi:hypothetical protein